MTHSPFKRMKWLLTGFTLTAMLLCTILSSQAGLRPEDAGKAAVAPLHSSPLPAQTPTATPIPRWREPTRPNAAYICDWKRPGSSGMAEVKFEYTRETPNGGWLGKLNTKYPDGKTRVDNMQLFAAKPFRRLGKEWSFQTTDGKITCKISINRESSEVRFGGCNNGVEQYCVDQRLMDSVHAFPDQPCGECRGRGVFDRVRCLTRCFNVLADRPVTFDCPVPHDDPSVINRGGNRSPVACMVLTYWTDRIAKMESGEASGSPEAIRALITQYGLAELRQNWIDFVNNGLGPCSSSVYCPVGTECSGGKCVDRTKWIN